MSIEINYKKKTANGRFGYGVEAYGYEVGDCFIDSDGNRAVVNGTSGSDTVSFDVVAFKNGEWKKEKTDTLPNLILAQWYTYFGKWTAYAV